MKLVILESPLAGNQHNSMERHVKYARECLGDCLKRGEAPFASHLLYPGTLDDSVPQQRWLGMTAGFAWGEVADYAVVYTDYGISRGMEEGIRLHQSRGLPVKYRKLYNDGDET